MLGPILCGATAGSGTQAPVPTPGSSQPPSEGFQMLMMPRLEAWWFSPVVRGAPPSPFLSGSLKYPN